MQASHHLQRDELIPLNGAYFLQEDLGTMTLGETDGMTNTPNLKQVEEWMRDRHILKVGLSGGSAESDSAIDLKSGRTTLGTYYNSRTDEAIFGDDLVPTNALNPKNVPLIIECVDAFPADCHIGILYKPKFMRLGTPNIPRS